MATYIIGAIVLGLLIFAVYRLYKDKKSNSCCGGCSGCMHKESCNIKEKE